VVTRVCEVCRQNDDLRGFAAQTFTLPAGAPVTASFVKLTITWSSAGGVGGCADLCDWATDVHELRAFSPGALPAAAATSRPLTPGSQAFGGDDCDEPAVALITQPPSGAGAALTGGATLRAAGAGHAPDAGSATLTAAAASRASTGAVEFTRIIRPAADCTCASLPSRPLMLSMYVWIGGGVLPGEGLVVSMVDATQQTPGATRFMPGCGVRAALPAHAISVVLDTADSDPACDEPGTGARIVSTLDGEDAPPRVTSSALEMRTPGFRRGAWVAVQLILWQTTFFLADAQLDSSTTSSVGGDGDDAATPTARRYAPLWVFVDGAQLLDASGLPRAVRMTAALSDAFYIVVSARSSAAGMDVHAISGLHLDCPALQPDVLLSDWGTVFSAWIVNWDGLRQPLTPPPFSRPAPPHAARMPPAPPASGGGGGGATSAAALGAASAAAAFCANAGAAVPRRRGVARLPPRASAARGGR
jgi:hypothetical protein